MYYIQIPEEHATNGFYTLIQHGTKAGSVQVLPCHVYVLNESQVQILKEENIPYQILTKEQLPTQQLEPR